LLLCSKKWWFIEWTPTIKLTVNLVFFLVKRRGMRVLSLHRDQQTHARNLNWFLKKKSWTKSSGKLHKINMAIRNHRFFLTYKSRTDTLYIYWKSYRFLTKCKTCILRKKWKRKEKARGAPHKKNVVTNCPRITIKNTVATVI
jgi:hypothetical protein